ncbi:flavodoxin family protein [Methanoregula sp.]|uniref:flavodoxin family protein n=1 Tax=Methanoregula sp. TaxID=2052170 RepID=UPI002BF17EF8|nr:flavodoxin family protein [Methanoregula sp.]HVP95713.1 flavodoxin family protein [Methanoregula sp.]
MTQVIAINGSPRKTWNTATLLGHALEGAASAGAQTEIVHLYDLDYKGCTSCFSCKLVGGKSYGKCAVQDDLTPVLERIRNADALILGSPIYVGTATGEMRSFLERLVFPYLVYDAARSSLFPKKMPSGVIYTMGADEARVKDMAYEAQFRLTAMLLERIFGPSAWFMVTDTLQFEDYSKYVSSGFDPEAKARRRREVFPEECKKAFEMGRRLAKGLPG